MVAKEILVQLGGNKFIAMTGSKNLVSDKNTLRMDLTRNKSGANKLFITLDVMDTYTMVFIKFSPFKINTKTGEITKEKLREIQKIEGVYFDQLQSIFTETTGLYTHL